MSPTPGPVGVTRGYGLADAPFDGSALPWASVERWLTGARSYWVCTTRPDGRPHAMPVWGCWLGEALWFSTDPESHKARNLLASPEAVVHLESGDEVCVLEGTVQRVSAAKVPQPFLDAYAVKYEFALDPSEPQYGVYRLVPEVALTWIESDMVRTATRWTFG